MLLKIMMKVLNGRLKCEVSRRLSLIFNEMRESDNDLALLNVRLKLTA
jgi:hypothetical protein